MRVLTKTLAVVSLLIPASAYPLGIGEIKLHSALNQNLDAEISLVLSPGEKLSDIKVSLAPSDKFDETGVPWTYFLSKIKFEPVTSNGSTVIKISSKEALKEPFLEFLLEVSWPKGSLYREFTVLVDPPEFYQQTAIPVISTGSDEYESERDYLPEQRTTPRSRTSVESSIGANGYGPTSRNDTLWKIAEQASRGSDISVEQMLIALYEENPHAFYKANINALLAGKTLKIPGRDVILKLSRKQAISEFNRQIHVWKSPDAREAIAETGQENSADNQLTLIAPAQESVSEKAIVTSGHGQQVTAEKNADNVSSVVAETESGKSTAHEGTKQKSEGSSTPADSAIQDKIAALEKQLAVMQELIALKDQQLAALQNQSQVKSLAQVSVEQTAPADVAVTKPGTTVPAAAVTKPEMAAPGAVAVTKPEMAAPGAVTVSKPVQPESELQPTKPAPSEAPIVQRPVAKPVVVRPVDHAKIETNEAVDWYYLGVGGAGTGLLVVLGWLWWRQRRLEDRDESASSFASAGFAKAAKSADIFSESVDDNNYGLDLAVGDNIFASDFAAGDFDVIDMDQGEIDPISEADVYLAYGRYQQAEDLMRDAIADQPERDECKLKLLEIFYANGNKQAFEAYAGELVDAGKKDDVVFWAKVTEMGSDICADSPLFSSNADTDLQKNTSLEVNPASEKASGATSDELIDNMDFDLAAFEELFDSTSVQDLFGEKNNLFDLGITSFENKPQAVKDDEEPKQNNESIDFDLSLFAVDAPASGEANKVERMPAVAEIKDEFESFDFNFSATDTEEKGMGEADLSAKDVPALDESYHAIDFSMDKTAGFDDIGSDKGDQDLFDNLNVDDTFTLDENYHAIDFSTDKTAGFNKPELDKNIQDSLDDFDFNVPAGLNEQGESSFGVSDLAEMDEMETKLDLAIAYVDMGDADAAKEIAMEVLKKGRAEQQMVARALLDGL